MSASGIQLEWYLKRGINSIFSYVKDIIHGLEGYLRKKCLSFPRLFFLSRDEMLALLCQTRDPTKTQEHLRLCFSGIHSLEFDELQVELPNPWRFSGFERIAEKFQGIL